MAQELVRHFMIPVSALKTGISITSISDRNYSPAPHHKMINVSLCETDRIIGQYQMVFFWSSTSQSRSKNKNADTVSEHSVNNKDYLSPLCQ